MLVLMCGLPSCGKTIVADIIAGTDSPVWIIRPEDWLPADVDKFSEEDEKHHRIECWRAALEEAEDWVLNKEYGPGDAAILDCGNSKFKPLNSLIRLAKRNGHKCVVLYVNSRPAQCEDRAGDRWVGKEIIEHYMANIKDSLPKFKIKCDRVVIAENTGTLDDLKYNALAAWSRLCQIM